MAIEGPWCARLSHRGRGDRRTLRRHAPREGHDPPHRAAVISCSPLSRHLRRRGRRQRAPFATTRARRSTSKYAYLVQTTDAMSNAPMRRLILLGQGHEPEDRVVRQDVVRGRRPGRRASRSTSSGPAPQLLARDERPEGAIPGTEPKTSFTGTDDAKKWQGTLRFDKTSAGGPKVGRSSKRRWSKSLEVSPPARAVVHEAVSRSCSRRLPPARGRRRRARSRSARRSAPTIARSRTSPVQGGARRAIRGDPSPC